MLTGQKVSLAVGIAVGVAYDIAADIVSLLQGAAPNVTRSRRPSATERVRRGAYAGTLR